MHELALIAATEWAKAHAAMNREPDEFGCKVAQVAMSVKATLEKPAPLLGLQAVIAALAAQSIPCGTQQSLEQRSSHLPHSPGSTSQQCLPDSQGGS